jgi:hypothetical protein
LIVSRVVLSSNQQWLRFFLHLNFKTSEAHYKTKTLSFEPVPFEPINYNSNIYQSVTFDVANPDYISTIDNNIYNYPFVVDVNNSSNWSNGMNDEQYCYSSQHRIPLYIHPESSISPSLHYSNYQSYGQYYLAGTQFNNKICCNHHLHRRDVYYSNCSSSPTYQYPAELHRTAVKRDNNNNNNLDYTTTPCILQRDEERDESLSHNLITARPSLYDNTGRVSNHNLINNHVATNILNNVVTPDTSMTHIDHNNNNNTDRYQHNFQTPSESTVYSLSMPSSCDDFSLGNSISYNSI